MEQTIKKYNLNYFKLNKLIVFNHFLEINKFFIYI